jgi:hypothetical protein
VAAERGGPVGHLSLEWDGSWLSLYLDRRQGTGFSVGLEGDGARVKLEIEIDRGSHRAQL